MSCSPVDVGRVSVWTAGVPPLPTPGTTRAGEATAGPERPGNNVQGGAGSGELRGKNHQPGGEGKVRVGVFGLLTFSRKYLWEEF